MVLDSMIVTASSNALKLGISMHYTATAAIITENMDVKTDFVSKGLKGWIRSFNKFEESHEKSNKQAI